ncbi:type 4b pilus protein PilO2 [Pseudovibrio ascidiaceicola]|uniref:type 4b pilus protein PilO2 n=1 Tax=Pseudovibrio ascidiaceicola TaxID=285279 RepID=UPI003D35D75A
MLDAVDVLVPDDQVGYQPNLIASDKLAVILVGKTKYAVNLLWSHTLNKRSAFRDARITADDLGKGSYDCFVISNTRYVQIGLGNMGNGHKVGLPSLANALQSENDTDWIGIFRVSEGYYFIAIRDGLHMQLSDRLFETETDAFNFFSAQVDTYEWQTIYAPDHFNITGALDESIEQLIGKKRTNQMLSISRKKVYLRMVAIAVAIGGVYYAVDSYINQLQQTAFYELVDNLQNSIRQNNKPQLPPLEMPWKSKPKAAQFLTTCGGEVRDFEYLVHGWELTNLTCTPNAVNANFKRTKPLPLGGGTVLHLEQALTTETFKPTIIDAGVGVSDRVIVQWSLNNQESWSNEIEPISIGPVKKAIRTYLESQQIEASFSQTNTSQYWYELQFVVKSDKPLSILQPIVSRVPAMTISSIDFKPESTSWVLSGSIYEKNYAAIKQRKQM